MKKTLVIALISICLVSSFPKAFAQENANRDSNGKVVSGPYETNRFCDNWFIDAGVGAGIYLGGQNKDFGKRFAPTFELGFGKWFTPSVGARISFDYINRLKEIVGSNTYKFNYWNIRADFMWNMSNALGGYKETRVYQAVPYVGAGYAQMQGSNYFSGVAHAFCLTAGIINKFRVSNRVDINIELNATALSHRTDRIPSIKTTIDVPISATAGVTIKLGKTNFKRVQPIKDNSKDVAAAVEAALLAKNAELKAKNAELEAANANNKKLASELENLKNQPAPAPVVTLPKVVYGDIPADGIIFFELGKSDLNKKERAHLETFAYYVKQIIASGKTITLVGSANKDASAFLLNQKLSEDRVNYVKNQLINRYGVDASKIMIKADGDMNNIFGDAELDRCVYVKF